MNRLLALILFLPSWLGQCRYHTRLMAETKLPFKRTRFWWNLRRPGYAQARALATLLLSEFRKPGLMLQMIQLGQAEYNRRKNAPGAKAPTPAPFHPPTKRPKAAQKVN